MSKFMDDHLVLRVPKSGDIRVLVKPLTYYSDIAGEYIIVPSGFHTDLGSIPRMLQGIFPKDGKAMFGYIVHDWLYKTGMYTRSISDDILEEAMRVLDVSWYTRKAVHNGLRVGGWVAWNEHRRNDDE